MHWSGDNVPGRGKGSGKAEGDQCGSVSKEDNVRT